MAIAIPIPSEIVSRVARLDKKGWPAMVEFPSGKSFLWTNLERATVAQLEQAVELESRRARKAIERFLQTGSKHSAAKAAQCISRARAFADWSLLNQGQTVSEASLPFPCMSVDEMREQIRKDRED